MSNVSKMVADRISISGTVMSSLTVHGPEVAPALEALLFPQGAPPDLTVALFLQALHDALARNRDRIGAADLAHAAELADDDPPRAARDAGLAALRANLIGLRATLLGTFGPATLASYGIPTSIPEAPELLVRAATLIEEQLRTRPLTEPPLQPGVSVNPVAVADAIRAQLVAVGDAVAAVERERREAQLTLEAKNKALAEWTAGYPGIASVTTGLFELAGRNDLADVVRPTARRRAGLTEAQDAGSDPSGAATTGSGGSTTGSGATGGSGGEKAGGAATAGGGAATAGSGGTTGGGTTGGGTTGAPG
jgi:hypothetical protein